MTATSPHMPTEQVAVEARQVVALAEAHLERYGITDPVEVAEVVARWNDDDWVANAPCDELVRKCAVRILRDRAGLPSPMERKSPRIPSWQRATWSLEP